MSSAKKRRRSDGAGDDDDDNSELGILLPSLTEAALEIDRRLLLPEDCPDAIPDAPHFRGTAPFCFV